MVKYIVLVMSSLLLFGCIMQVKYIEVAPGCPKIPATVFEKVGIDGKLGASSFGKVVTGDASLAITPEIVSAVSQAVTDDQITDAYVCAAGKRGELTTPEQFNYARNVARFFKTSKPTAKEVLEYHKQNPFPKAVNSSELLSIPLEQLASNKTEARLVAVHSIINHGLSSPHATSQVIEILSTFVKTSAAHNTPGSISSDIQAAVAALVSKEFAVRPLNLEGTILPGVIASNGQFKSAKLSNIRWIGGKLPFANLEDANLVGAHLERADLSHSILDKSNLLGAGLDMANFRHAKLRGANLSGASLKGAVFEGADLSQAILAGARTDGVQWGDANVCGVIGLSNSDSINRSACM